MSYSILGGSALFLGFVGYMEVSLADLTRRTCEPFFTGCPRVVLNSIWRTIALFFLEANLEPEYDAWKLVWARLLAPAATASVVIEIVHRLFARPIALFRARWRPHTIIVGCGERGQLFLHALQGKSTDRRVVIDKIDDPAIVQGAHAAGAIFLDGDASTDTLLKKAGLAKAKQLFILCGEDTQNLKVLTTAREVRQNASASDALKVLVHIDNSSLVRQLDRDDEFARESGCDVTAFNLAAATARRFFEEHPLVDQADLRGQRRVHLVCVGWTPFVFEVLEQLARLSPFRRFPRPRVDLLVSDPDSVRSELDSVQPAIWDLLRIKLHGLDRASSIPTGGQMELVEPGPKATVTAVLVSVGQDAETTAAALATRERSQQNSRWRAPVFAHIKNHNSLSSLITKSSQRTDPGQTIIPVGFEDDVCGLDVLAGRREDLAQRIHESYIKIKGVDSPTSDVERAENDQPWERLKQTYRLACRRAADHLPIKILSVGAKQLATPEKQANPSAIATQDFTLASPDRLESLAELEHRSWEIDRRLDGWRPGTQRDDRARIHPALIPYGELPTHLQDFDRDQIRTVSLLLQKDDAPPVKREYRLGILGHNKISRDEKALILRKLDRTVMPELLHAHRFDFVSVCTPLAPGADTILTEAVLKCFEDSGIDHRLIVIRALPVSTVIEDFEASFSDQSEWRRMDSEPSGDWSEVKRQIAGHLAKITGMKNTFVADLTPPGLAVDDFQTDGAQRTLAYRRAGAWLAEKSDILIAYHDPKRISGPGGTRETLQWAQKKTSIPADLSTLNRGKKEKATTPRMMIIEP